MITKRVLTMKSKVGFGKYPDEPIERLIECERASWIRYIYYNCEVIDYTQEVKDAARIFISIDKPGVSPDAGRANERKVWDEQRATMSEDDYMHMVMKKKAYRRHSAKARRESNYFGNTMSKGALQAVNHGRAYIVSKEKK